MSQNPTTLMFPPGCTVAMEQGPYDIHGTVVYSGPGIRDTNLSALREAAESRPECFHPSFHKLVLDSDGEKTGARVGFSHRSGFWTAGGEDGVIVLVDRQGLMGKALMPYTYAPRAYRFKRVE